MAGRHDGKANFNTTSKTLPSGIAAQTLPQKPLVEIPKEEQWRIIQQTGILDAVKLQDRQVMEERSSLGDEIFNAVLLIIPFSSILLLMEILIRHQYGKQADLEVLMDRMVSGVPILSIFVFYTMRYKHHRRMQYLLFVLSCMVGSRLIYQYNRASWLVNMNQCPPLVTVWIYTILQLDLGPAVLSLCTVASFVCWKGLEIK